MALHPGVAKRARTEIDEVIGTDWLPTFEDRESLPYINALVKEVFRWYTVVPAGLLLFHSHHATEITDSFQPSLIVARRTMSMRAILFRKVLLLFRIYGKGVPATLRSQLISYKEIYT